MYPFAGRGAAFCLAVGSRSLLFLDDQDFFASAPRTAGHRALRSIQSTGGHIPKVP